MKKKHSKLIILISANRHVVIDGIYNCFLPVLISYSLCL